MQPTDKMINFANIICSVLKLEPPDLSDFKSTHEFIANNSDAYWELVNARNDNLNIINYQMTKLKDQYIKINCKLSDEFLNKLDVVKGICGIYLLWSGKNLIYIGKSLNLKSRILSSIAERNSLKLPITSVSYINTIATADMHILEPLLITEYKPILNTEFNCNDYSNHFKSNIDMLQVFKNRLPIIDNEVDYCSNNNF